MTTKPKPRARRKKAVPTLQEEIAKLRAVPGSTWGDCADPVRDLLNDRHDGFYTPIDGWKPDTRGMLTRMDSMLRIMNQHRRDNPFEYWAAVRKHMI